MGFGNVYRPITMFRTTPAYATPSRGVEYERKFFLYDFLSIFPQQIKVYEMQIPTKRIFGLDVMRATAILMVLSSHILWIYPASSGAFISLIHWFGYLGVELFFVLSGFLIGGLLLKVFLQESFSLSTLFWFLKRRWFRTLPNYYLVLGINLLIALVIGYTLDDPWKYFFFWQNLASPMLPFFTESWSLSVEEYAYVLLPAVLGLGYFLFQPTNKSTYFFWSVICLILVFIVNKYIWYTNHPNPTLEQWNLGLKSVVIFRLDAIFMGVLFSWIHLNFQTFWIKYQMFFAYLGLFLLFFLTVGIAYFNLSILTHPFFWTVLYLPLNSVAIAFFLPLLSQWTRLNISWLEKPIVHISKISYSIYLLHYGVILQLLKFYFPTETLTFSSLHFYTFIYLLLTFIASHLLYRYYEKPMMDLRD